MNGYKFLESLNQPTTQLMTSVYNQAHFKMNKICPKYNGRTINVVTDTAA